MKLLMLKLVHFSRTNITQLAAGIIDTHPGSCVAPEQMQQIITHNDVLKDFSLLCMCVTDMTGLTADVFKELLLTTESDCSQLKLSLQRLVRYVEDYVIKVAEIIISTIELEDAAEFESAMEEFNHVPIPEEITKMSNKELQNIWFNF